MELPLVAPVRQVLHQSALVDIASEVRQRWHGSQLAQSIKPGNRVAVAVGSRGIANIATIARATVDVLRDLGAQPFIVAAMGSHGGGTAEGQREILASYGVTEHAMRVPVKSDMAVVQLGTNSWGEPVWWDKNAWEADAVLTISRIKAHTDFHSKLESGITKMLVIGLGKREGAGQHHRWGIRGLRDMLPETARVVVDRTKFVAGLAVLENASDQTAVLQVVHRDELFDVEPRLLDQAKGIMGKLPFEQLDLLVIGEIGKNYSGAGIDPNVVGRLLMETEPEHGTPHITRICALDLSPESHGNGTGIGIADLTTEQLLAKIEPGPFRLNSLTSCFLWRSKLPIGLPDDRECVAMGLKTCWQPRPEALRMAVIPNTLELSELWVSANLAEEAEQKAGLEVTGTPQELPFDGNGHLDQEQLFPHSVRSRRSHAS